MFLVNPMTMGRVVAAASPLAISAVHGGAFGLATSHSLDIAAVSRFHESGDVYVLFVRTGGLTTPHSTPAGWTMERALDSGGTTTIYRHTSGLAPDDAAVIDLSGNSRSLAYHVWRISGTPGGAVIDSDLRAGNNANMNLLPTTATRIWLAVASSRAPGSVGTFTYPAGYTEAFAQQSNNFGSTLGTAVLQAAADYGPIVDAEAYTTWGSTGGVYTDLHTSVVSVRGLI